MSAERHRTFQAVFEWVVVKPYFEDGVDIDRTAGQARQLEPDYPFAATPRIWLGCRDASGLGARVRYWQFHQDSDRGYFAELNAIEVHGLKLDSLDVELTQAGRWGCLDATASGGLRYARLAARLSVRDFAYLPPASGWSESCFEGMGPTVALDLSRPVAHGKLALVGSLRGSLLFGRQSMNVQQDGVWFRRHLDEDDLVFALESQVGVEYVRVLRRGGRLSARAAMEGQVWGLAAGDPHYGGEDDLGPAEVSVSDTLGFFGASVAFSYQR